MSANLSRRSMSTTILSADQPHDLLSSREIVAMRYLWDEEVLMDGGRLRADKRLGPATDGGGVETRADRAGRMKPTLSRTQWMRWRSRRRLSSTHQSLC